MSRRLNLEDEKELMALGKALSSEIRIRILELLQKEPLCVNEIAEILEIPPSSAALHVRVLQEANLIRTELKPGIRGSMKLCILQETSILLHLEKRETKKREEIISMPVGNYVDYKITPTCGMVNEEEYIDGEDEPDAFMTPEGRLQSWCGFPPVIWNIVFQMQDCKEKMPKEWNFPQNCVRKPQITI